MKLRLSKIDKIILLAGSLILVLIIVFGQFIKLIPLKSELSIKQQTLEMEQKLLEVVSEKKTDDATKVVEDTKELQKKVPAKPLLEQFILELEKAETVSNSLIKSMSFTKDADALPAETETPTETNSENTTADPSVDTSQEGTAETDKQTASTQSNGIKKLTVSLSVESPTYEDLEKFIEVLESLERIVVVEQINYSGGEEITSLDQEKEPLAYSLTVSAYYLPELNDLIADLPKIDAPAPANKENPLSTFSDTTTAN